MTAMTTPAAAPDGERADLLAELATARAALTRAVRDLSDEQAGTRPTASALCLGGLIKHVAGTEEQWLRFVLDGPAAMDFDLPAGVTWADLEAGTARELPRWIIERGDSFQMLPGDTLAAILARYEQVAARTEEIVAGLPDLSATRPLPSAPWFAPGTVHSARRVLIHVIAETAQHAGHADILREAIDGRTAT